MSLVAPASVVNAVNNTYSGNVTEAQYVSNTNNISGTNPNNGDSGMSYSNIASSLTSVVTSLVSAITNFLAGVANFIAQNADIFVALAVAGIIVGVITKFASSLPFVGSFLGYLGL
jgi:TRAP-type uncharacterized transport system fused permease subunit